jgi:hypothetical protein
MQKINSTGDLSFAIAQLKKKQAGQIELLQAQLYHTYDSLKPLNLIRNTILQAAGSADIKYNILNTSAGLTAGFLIKKLLVGKSTNPVLKIAGNALMFGVTNLVGKHPGFMIAVKDKFFKMIRYHRAVSS